MPYGPRYNYAVQNNMICTPYYLKIDSFTISEAAVKCLNLVSYLINAWHNSSTQIYKQK